MPRKLAHGVHVYDKNGEVHVFAAGDSPPAALAKQITNPAAWGIDRPVEVVEVDMPPPPLPEPPAEPEPVVVNEPAAAAADAEPVPDVALLDDDTIATVLAGSTELVLSAVEGADLLHIAQLADGEAARPEPRSDLIAGLNAIVDAAVES